MVNAEVRSWMAGAGLKQWQVAAMIGVSEGRFSTMMRSELKDEVKEKIRYFCEETKRREGKQ